MGAPAKAVHGRAIITWPAQTVQGSILAPMAIAIHDFDTGEPIIALSLSIVIGDAVRGWSDGPIEVDLNQAVDADGAPTTIPIVTEAYAAHRAAGGTSVDFEGEQYRIKKFRYVVTEMRTAPALGSG